MIVLSGIVGVVGAVEITKCAEMHKLNMRHLKHNHLFADELAAFALDEESTTAGLERELSLVRDQPIDCLDILGPMERAVIHVVGTERAITVCEEDIELADQAFSRVEEFHAGRSSRAGLVAALEQSKAGFTANSVEFEPLVERTVGVVSKAVVSLVILKAIIVGLAGWLMARSVRGDYQKLVETEESLERTNSELQNFVYRTSHDFMSPLLGIKGMAEFIEEDLREGNVPEALENVGRVKKNAAALENVVVSTLRVAKSDLAETHIEPVPLAPLISEIESRLAALAGERDVNILLGDSASKLTLDTDRSHLTVILENLISNGIKYSDETCGDSYVRVDAGSPEEGRVHITVKDNGIGIPKKYHGEVFGMFRQFHPDRAEGTGLGLYIVKKSVERLDADVSVESSPSGTCVTATFPIR